MSSKTKINLKDKISDGEIDLSVSEIKDVPVKDIAIFKKVFSLDLSNNLIVTLPKLFAPLLVHITKLDLSKNQLCELPENFGDLVKLKHLDLYRNQLQHLPLSFGKLSTLRWLDLKDNPLLPAIRTIIRDTAGNCGDSKECLQCAKDIVTFYAKMAASVEEEKMARERQKEEDRKQKELALKTQKHKDKKKQNKLNKLEQKQQQELLNQQQKGMQDLTKNGCLTINNGLLNKNSKKGQVEENRKSNSKQKGKMPQSSKNKSISLWGFIWNIIWTFLMVSLTLFVITSIKAPITQPIENKMVEWWQSVVVTQLPTEYLTVERQWADSLAHAHNVTGSSLLRLYHVCSVQINSIQWQQWWQPARDYVQSIYSHLVTPRE